MKWNIYHKYRLFPLFFVQSRITLFHWIIVEDDKNSISLYEPNFFCKNFARVYALVNFYINEIYSYICLRVFPVLWNIKIPTTTVGIITLNAFKRWLKQETIVKNSSTYCAILLETLAFLWWHTSIRYIQRN